MGVPMMSRTEAMPGHGLLLWWLSLLFVAWMIWAETSFQYYDTSLGADLDLSPAQLAMIGGAFLLTYSLVQVPVGWLLDRWPAERMLLAGVAVAILCSLGFGRAHHFEDLLFLRLGLGLACAVAFPASGLLARRSLPPHRFSLAMGATESLLGFGAALAAVIPILIGTSGWRLQVIVQAIALLILVAIPLLLLQRRRFPTSPSPDEAPAAAPPARWSARACRSVLHASGIYACAGGLLFGLGQYNLLSQSQHWSDGLRLSVTLVLSLALAGGMLLAGRLGSLPRRRRPLLLGGFLLTLAALVVLVGPADSAWLRMVAGGAFGLGLGPCVLAFPIAVVAAPPDRTAFVVAIVNTAGTLAGALFTIVSGWLLQRAAADESDPVLLVYGPLALAGILLALRTPQR